MVQREQWDTSWGPKKIIFLIREIDDAATAGASVESCRFAARRSPRGRFWSVIDVRKRLQRVRDPFHHSIHIKQGAQPINQLEPIYIYIYACIYIHVVYMYTGLAGWLLRTDLSD